MEPTNKPTPKPKPKKKKKKKEKSMSLFDTSMWCYHSIKVQVKLMIY